MPESLAITHTQRTHSPINKLCTLAAPQTFRFRCTVGFYVRLCVFVCFYSPTILVPSGKYAPRKRVFFCSTAGSHSQRWSSSTVRFFGVFVAGASAPAAWRFAPGHVRLFYTICTVCIGHHSSPVWQFHGTACWYLCVCEVSDLWFAFRC